MSSTMTCALQVYADGNPIAAGCRLRLSGSEALSLHPGFFLLSIRNLSSTSAALLAEAKRLLLSTHLSQREIARSCAFNSESYLERVFQRRFGQTMREFRKLGGGGSQPS